jgi:hypothetical protein
LASAREDHLSQFRALKLRAGEWVEVRSREEILATLDERGRLQNLAFMPEMLPFCGLKLRVYKRADKTCDPAHTPWSIRRLKDTVHLEGARCDGAGHGGCQAGCLIFWHEAWLKRAESTVVPMKSLHPPAAAPLRGNGLCTIENILTASQLNGTDAEPVYSCQATEIRNYSFDMAWWDPRQYVRDLRSGNATAGLARDSRSERALEWIVAALQLFRAWLIDVFNYFQGRLFHRSWYPFVGGALEKTPTRSLDLQPGELVEVLSKAEIVATLDKSQRNRGLYFDSEMVPYCGNIYRVLRRVTHIIDEKSGKMINMKNPCIILEGVICRSDFHRLCPRAIYCYWRESWLKRATDVAIPIAAPPAETCEKC